MLEAVNRFISMNETNPEAEAVEVVSQFKTE